MGFRYSLGSRVVLGGVKLRIWDMRTGELDRYVPGCF
jgi:hypothetical protein